MQLPKAVNRRIGLAMHDYQMLADGDRVMIAVSGGVDSLVAALILQNWQKKAPIRYDLLAVHLDMGFEGNETDKIKANLKRIGIDFTIEQLEIGKQLANQKPHESPCFLCARQRRNRLFDMAGENNFNKIVFGHHKDDIVETFLMNIFFAGNISTMVPKQMLFKNTLAIIRPMAYLIKEEIVAIARNHNLTPAKNPCPYSEGTKRTETRRMLEKLYLQDKKIRANIFAALSNVRPEYLPNKQP